MITQFSNFFSDLEMLESSIVCKFPIENMKNEC